MSKKRIHLTENQLHKLIEQTINELDWRTYMNAANKMKARYEKPNGRSSDWDNSFDLADHAANKFNKENNRSDDVSWHFIPTDKGNGDYVMRTNDYTHAFYLDPDNPTSVISANGEDDLLRDFAKDKYVYDKEEHKWRPKMPNESIARRVTESVMRKLRRMR